VSYWTLRLSTLYAQRDRLDLELDAEEEQGRETSQPLNSTLPGKLLSAVYAGARYVDGRQQTTSMPQRVAA
jgi:hypothetical protein